MDRKSNYIIKNNVFGAYWRLLPLLANGAQNFKDLTTYAIRPDTTIQPQEYCNKKKIYNNRCPLKELKLHLYPNAFREGAKIKPVSESAQSRAYPKGPSYGDIIINEVYVAGKKADFNIGGEDRNIMTVKFPMDLYPSACFTIEFDFLLRLAHTPHRLGYTDKCVNLGNWFPIACVYEDGGFATYAYYPNGDPFIRRLPILILN